MRRHEPLREYSLERRLRTHRTERCDDISNADLLEAIQGLREEVRALRQNGIPAAAAVAVEETGLEESLAARVEIARMVRTIGKAKMEIASIKHPMSDDDRVQRATSELDEIVLATEASTNSLTSLTALVFTSGPMAIPSSMPLPTCRSAVAFTSFSTKAS